MLCVLYGRLIINITFLEINIANQGILFPGSSLVRAEDDGEATVGTVDADLGANKEGSRTGMCCVYRHWV